jgi:hypothetical protein
MIDDTYMTSSTSSTNDTALLTRLRVQAENCKAVVLREIMLGLRKIILKLRENTLACDEGAPVSMGEQALTRSGVRTIDPGKGDEPYKRRLMTGAVELREGYVELPSLLASARRLRRAAEARAARGGMAATLRLPLRAMRRIERTRRFRWADHPRGNRA